MALIYLLLLLYEDRSPYIRKLNIYLYHSLLWLHLIILLYFHVHLILAITLFHDMFFVSLLHFEKHQNIFLKRLFHEFFYLLLYILHRRHLCLVYWVIRIVLIYDFLFLRPFFWNIFFNIILEVQFNLIFILFYKFKFFLIIFSFLIKYFL